MTVPCLNIEILFRSTIRPKLCQLLWIYDDELRNPTEQSTTRLRKLELHDYDMKLADAKCNAHLAHLVPQVRDSSFQARLQLPYCALPL